MIPVRKKNNNNFQLSAGPVYKESPLLTLTSVSLRIKYFFNFFIVLWDTTSSFPFLSLSLPPSNFNGLFFMNNLIWRIFYLCLPHTSFTDKTFSSHPQNEHCPGRQNYKLGSTFTWHTILNKRLLEISILFFICKMRILIFQLLMRFLSILFFF